MADIYGKAPNDMLSDLTDAFGVTLMYLLVLASVIIAGIVILSSQFDKL